MSLKTSVGGRDSNSFATVAEADTYIELMPSDPAEWNSLTTVAKEYRLVLAAQLFGMLPLKGRTIYCGQALAFPRDVSGTKGAYPAVVKEAQIQIAYLVIHRGLANQPGVEDSSAGPDIKSISLGGLLSVTYAGTAVAGGSLLDRVSNSINFQTYLTLKRYLSQIRGCSIAAADDEDFPTCSTTSSTSSTSSTASTTSSTMSSSSTTSTTV